MDLKDRQYRFENHLDGHGVKSLWRREDRRPEEILWLHLKYMRHFVERMTNLESTRMYMSFAGTSKILILQPCHDDVIPNHANTFAIEPAYLGPDMSRKELGPMSITRALTPQCPLGMMTNDLKGGAPKRVHRREMNLIMTTIKGIVTGTGSPNLKQT